MLSSCSQPSSKETQDQATVASLEIESEISGVYVLFRNSLPADGEWSGEQDYNSEIIDEIEYEEVEDNNEIFYCYDTQYLIKIEILGYVKNANILYKYPLGKTISLLENTDINGQFVISPSSLNSYLNGGKIIIKSKNKVLKEFIILYEGCL